MAQVTTNPTTDLNLWEQIKTATGGSGGPAIATISVQRIPTLLSAAGTGTIAAGSINVSIANTGTATGIVLGANLIAGATVNFQANAPDTIGTIAYDATGTSFLIARLT